MTIGSTLLIFSTDPVLVDAACEALAPWGWLCRSETVPGAVIAALSEAPAAILVDQRLGQASEVIAEIRGSPPPANATPVLTIGAQDRGAAGSGGQLAWPLVDQDFRELLRQWTGPLDDHTARAEPWSFRYKLLRLIGLDNADAMLARLRDNLAEAARDSASASAHRLAGLAGICGFPEVSQAWARVDRGDQDAARAAVAVSRAAVAEIDLALGSPAAPT